jgi:cardiolipin synthase
MLGVALLVVVGAPLKAFSVEARLGLSPDNGKAFLTKTLEEAQSEIVLNFYQFEEPSIVQLVKQKIREGVSVRILVEGSPVGGFTQGTAGALTELRSAVHASKVQVGYQIGVMKKTTADRRRYTYDHAKYAVIDRKTVFVSSENVKSGAYVNAGKVGNRGWHVAVKDDALAAHFLRAFDTDFCQGCSDIWDALARGVPTPTVGQSPPKPEKSRSFPVIPEVRTQVAVQGVVFAPRAVRGLVELINSADTSVDLQYLSLPPTWLLPSNTRIENPVLTALSDAAKRHVKVRVLLNDERVFAGGGKGDQKGDLPAATNKNLQSVCALYRLAQSRGLELDARIVDIQKSELSYIHNKGILVDGEQVLISSINGTHNSIELNRETGVILSSRDAHAYYKGAFDVDWGTTPVTESGACKTAGGPGANESLAPVLTKLFSVSL